MKNSLSLLRSLPADDAILRPLVRQLIQDEQQIDDVLQETRIAALQHHVPGQGQPPTGWLRRVAWNFALRRKRADARRRVHEQHAAVPDTSPSPDEILEREDARHAVVEAIRALDEPYRSVILYRYFEDLPPREMARRLDISVAAVKTRLTRALRKLRARLDGRFDGDRRAWQIVLLPLATGLPAGGAVAGAATASTALTTLTGSIVMSLKAKLVTAALAVVVFGTVASIILTTSSRSSREPAPAIVSTMDQANAARPEVGTSAPATAGPVTPPAPDRQARPGPAPTAAGLAAAGRLSGTLHFDDEPPTPCEGAEVFVLQEQTGRWKLARTAPSGAYRIPELAPGVWKVLVRPVDYPEISGTHVKVNAGQDTVQNFVVQRGIVVSGRVVDSRTREGIAGASIVFQGRRAHTVTSGEDGAYVARGLDPDMLGRVTVAADGYQPTWERFTLDDVPVQTARIDFQLRPLARIHGVVLDPAGVPVSGARVTTAFPFLFRQDRPGTTTDASGRFTILVSGGGSGNHERPIALFAHRPGHAPGRTEPTYHADGETVPDVTIRLGRVGSLAGSVVGDIAPDGAVVLLWPAGPDHANRPARRFSRFALREENQYRITAADDGQFRIDDLAPGTYECGAVHGSHGSPRQTLEIRPGQTTRVRLELGLPEGAISGRVVDDHGQPVAGARVQVRTARINPSVPLLVWRRLQSDHAGHFAADHLLDADYFVQAHKRGFDNEAQETVRPGPDPVVIRLRRLPAIHGVVMNPDGAPARCFHLTIYRDRADTTARMTWRTVKDAPGGAFQVHVQSGDRAERYWIQARTDEGLASPRVSVDVIPGQESEPVRIQLTDGATLRGLVRGQKGRPVASASVQLEAHDSRDQRYTSTTLSGRFRYTGLTPGTYEIRAVHHEQGAAVKTFRMASPGEHDLTLILDTTGSTIRLVVQTAEGRPVVGARVYRCEPVKARHQTAFERRKRVEPKLTWDDYRRRLVHTDPDGRWEGRFLPPRTYHLLVRAEGFQDHEIQIDLGPEQEIHRTVVLEREPNPNR